MIQGSLTVSPSDLNNDLLEKIKALIQGHDIDVVISFKKTRKSRPLQTKAQYFEQLDKAIQNIENRTNLVSFGLEELTEFSRK